MFNHKNYDKTCIKSVVNYAKQLENNSIRDLCDFQFSKTYEGKGRFGILLEEIYFGYKANSKSEPDFVDIGLELKTAPLKRLKKGNLSVKERLVLNMINYNDIINENFITSTFWIKNQHLLLVFYLWIQDQLPYDYTNKLVETWKFSKKDLIQIEKDWLSIQSKVTKGIAHTISGKDTFYLEASPKGSDKKSSQISQPNSKILAQRRAFALKPRYVNLIYNSFVGKNKSQSVLSENELNQGNIESLIENRFNEFVGLSTTEIENKLGISLNPKSKNYYDSMTKRMLGVKENYLIEEFEKANVIRRTIRVEENNTIREHISFPSFRFIEIINENWEDSKIKDFVQNKFLFLFFKRNRGTLRFEKVKFWSLSAKDIDEFRIVFNRTKIVLESGNIVLEKTKNGIIKNNFPKSYDSYLTHVRPHANDKKDTFPLPKKDEITGMNEFTKQCFWLNKSYIENIYRCS